MAISRTRSLGPIYHQPHVVAQDWYWDPAKKQFVAGNKQYCIGDINYRNMWITSQKQCVDETHPGPPWNDGGPLFVKKWFNPPTCGQSGTYVLTSPNGIWQRRGGFWHGTSRTSSDYSTTSAMSDLGTRYGAVGWNRFRPAKPSVDLGQFFGELREFFELLPGVVKSFIDLGPKAYLKQLKGGSGTKVIKDFGSDPYLNYQFGWKPFLRDVADFFDSMRKVERTISFLRRNNNKWILRGGTIKQTDMTGAPTSVACCVRPQLNTYYHLTYPLSASPTICTPVESERIWFKARMKYYIPTANVDSCDSILSSSLLRKIYGLEISPALFWKLTPWSWLVDWFCNYGDVISVCMAMVNDNLTAKYAYVMRSYEKSLYYDTTYKFSCKEGISNVKLKTHYVLSTKQRAEASPFGFNVSWGDISNSPWRQSILAALGLSRLIR